MKQLSPFEFISIFKSPGKDKQGIVKDEDYFIAEKLLPGFKKFDETDQHSIIKNSIQCLDRFICDLWEESKKQKYDGSTLSIINFYIEKSKEAKGGKILNFVAASVGDSPLFCIDNQNFTYKQLTRSHNCSEESMRQENPQIQCIEKEEFKIYRLFVGEHESNTSLARAIGDLQFKKAYPSFTAVPEICSKKLRLQSNIKLLVTSDGIEFYTKKDNTEYDAEEDEETREELKDTENIKTNFVEYCIEKKIAVTAENIVNHVKQLKTKDNVKDDVTVVEADIGQFYNLPDELIELEHGFTIGVFDGHGGHSTARLSQIFYTSIQNSWALLNVIRNNNFASIEDAVYLDILNRALFSLAQQLSEKTGADEILQWARSELSSLPFELLLFGPLLDELEKFIDKKHVIDAYQQLIGIDTAITQRLFDTMYLYKNHPLILKPLKKKIEKIIPLLSPKDHDIMEKLMLVFDEDSIPVQENSQSIKHVKNVESVEKFQKTLEYRTYLGIAEKTNFIDFQSSVHHTKKFFNSSDYQKVIIEKTVKGIDHEINRLRSKIPQKNNEDNKQAEIPSASTIKVTQLHSVKQKIMTKIADSITSQLPIETISKESKKTEFSPLIEKVHREVHKEIDTLSKLKEIDQYQNKIQGYLKCLCGILLSIPTLGGLWLSTNYKNFWFHSTTKKNIHKLATGINEAKTAYVI